MIYTNKELKPTEYKRECHRPTIIGMESAIDNALLLGIDAMKRHGGGMPPTYPNNESGFNEFSEQVTHFFEHIRDVNCSCESDADRLIPSVELLSQYLGISRTTLNTYQSQRGEEWETCITRAKDLILSIQQQLAFKNKMSPVMFIFTATNNHDYINASEFKLHKEISKDNNLLSIEKLPDLRLEGK